MPMRNVNLTAELDRFVSDQGKERALRKRQRSSARWIADVGA